MKGTWKKSSGSESSDVLVYLLDHCLLIIKPKQNEEKYKLYRKVNHSCYFLIRFSSCHYWL
jgi:hypothetical protein